MLGYGIICAGLIGFDLMTLPSGFLHRRSGPSHGLCVFTLKVLGMSRTDKSNGQVEDYFLEKERGNVEAIFYYFV